MTNPLDLLAARGFVQDVTDADELRDLDLCERFGWTLGELDDQDMARVLPGIVAQNVRASLSRLNTFLGTLGRVPPSKDDMEVYGWVKRMMTEAEAGDDG